MLAYYNCFEREYRKKKQKTSAEGEKKKTEKTKKMDASFNLTL